jgi:hypothetical protein
MFFEEHLQLKRRDHIFLLVCSDISSPWIACHTNQSACAEERGRGHIMRSTLHLFAIAAMVATFASSTLAQDTGGVVIEKHGNLTTETDFKPAGTTNLNIQMLKDFSSVKQNDPAVAPQLANDPSLVEKQDFLQKHPTLQAFLNKYPDARHELETNPGNFMPPAPGSKWASHEASGIPRDK